MSAPSKTNAPYIGLIPYAEEDAAFFFGREREQNFITANLLAERLTLLYGASGVGKSSVLRAGVEHHIRLLARENIERLGKPKYVFVFFNEWRETDPVRSVLLRVQESVERTLSGEKIEPVPSSLQFAEALFEWSKRLRGQLLIVLDQFEEYFLYHENEDGKGTFAEEFPRAVRSPGLPANFLVSFREDAFARMAFFKLRMPDLFGNYLPIDHLDRDAGRDAIEKPIAQYNKLYGNGRSSVSIEPSLVEEVLKQVETGRVILGDSGRGMLKNETSTVQIETPFLQMVMMRLWEEDAASGLLRLETLNRLGDETRNETGAERIVRTHLDQKMDTLSPERQDIGAEVFHYLVTPSGTKIAHTVSDLAEYAGLQPTQLAPVLEELAHSDTRILRGVAPPPDQPGESRYEIFHDVLAGAILDWRTRHVQARERAETERLAEQQRREAAESERAEAQQRRLELEAKSARRLRWLTALLVLTLVCVAALAVYAFMKRGEAERQTEVAENQKQEAQTQKKLAEQETLKANEASQRASDQAQELARRNQQLDQESRRANSEANIARINKDKAVKAEGRVRQTLKQVQEEDDSRVFLDDERNSLEVALARQELLLNLYKALGDSKRQTEARARMERIERRLSQTTQ